MTDWRNDRIGSAPSPTPAEYCRKRRSAAQPTASSTDGIRSPDVCSGPGSWCLRASNETVLGGLRAFLSAAHGHPCWTALRWSGWQEDAGSP